LDLTTDKTSSSGPQKKKLEKSSRKSRSTYDPNDSGAILNNPSQQNVYEPSELSHLSINNNNNNRVGNTVLSNFASPSKISSHLPQPILPPQQLQQQQQQQQQQHQSSSLFSSEIPIANSIRRRKRRSNEKLRDRKVPRTHHHLAPPPPPPSNPVVNQTGLLNSNGGNTYSSTPTPIPPNKKQLNEFDINNVSPNHFSQQQQQQQQQPQQQQQQLFNQYQNQTQYSFSQQDHAFETPTHPPHQNNEPVAYSSHKLSNNGHHLFTSNTVSTTTTPSLMNNNNSRKEPFTFKLTPLNNAPVLSPLSPHATSSSIPSNMNFTLTVHQGNNQSSGKDIHFGSNNNGNNNNNNNNNFVFTAPTVNSLNMNPALVPAENPSPVMNEMFNTPTYATKNQTSSHPLSSVVSSGTFTYQSPYYSPSTKNGLLHALMMVPWIKSMK